MNLNVRKPCQCCPSEEEGGGGEGSWWPFGDTWERLAGILMAFGVVLILASTPDIGIWGFVAGGIIIFISILLLCWHKIGTRRIKKRLKEEKNLR